MQLYPAPCLTKRVDWTINASMDLDKACRGTEGRLSINSLVTKCDSRPGIKAAITQTCCGPKNMIKGERDRHTRVQELSEWTDVSQQHIKQVWSHLQGNTTVLLFIYHCVNWYSLINRCLIWFEVVWLLWIIWSVFPTLKPFHLFTKHAKLLKPSNFSHKQPYMNLTE